MATPLFRLTHDQFDLDWSAASPTELRPLWEPPGRLRVTGEGVAVDRRRPDYLHDPTGSEAGFDHLGPRLHEETSYAIYARPAPGRQLRLRHDDPVLLNGLTTTSDGTVHGIVNFGSAAGRSRFEVEVDGNVSASFEVEVFPTKLDYETDYRAMVADVQDLATSLALEYLRSTFQFGSATRDQRPVGDLDWVLLLRALIDDLERALRQVARGPRRTIVRPMKLRPADRVRRPDSAVRASVRTQAGRGPAQSIGGDLVIRQHVWSRHAIPTLDTPEHRWLSTQLRTVRRGLARLVAAVGGEPEPQSRRERQVEDLRALEQRLAQLERLEPLLEASGDPPPNFASQQLQTAPGYREAYQTLLVLRSGLRLEGEAVRTSTKELHRLYEYWCYLTVVRLLASSLGHPPQLDQLFKIRANGLRIELGAGRAAEVRFATPCQRIRVRYNPRFSSSDVVLVPQRPDILITLEAEHWPTVHLLLDAKYRRDDSPEYRSRYGAPGPPEDALNVLHRYRDAILEVEAGSTEPQRTVVEAAALFPHEVDDDFRSTRHWRSLHRIGVGAVPALPSNVSYLEEWIGGALTDGSWSLADRAIQHVARSRYQAYVAAANTRVRVVVLTAQEVSELVSSDVFVEPWSGEAQLTAAFLCVLVRPSGSSRPVRVVTRPIVGRQLHAADIELHLGEPEYRYLDVDLDLTAVPAFTTQLALLRSERLSELRLRHVAEWRLRDQLSHAGFYPKATLGSPQSDEVWLAIAADARARYDTGGRWVVESGPKTHRVPDHEAYPAVAGLLQERGAAVPGDASARSAKDPS